MATSQLLPCSIDKGMFSTEVAVELQTETGQPVSLFVDNGLVIKKGEQHFLKVTVIGENGKPHHKSVLLPSEAFETGSRWLSVPDEMLQTA